MDILPLAPVQLHEYTVTELSYRRAPLSKPAPDAEVVLRFETQAQALEGGEIALTLRTTFNDGAEEGGGDYEHRGAAAVTGRFAWHGDGPEDEERRRLLLVNGFSLLYGILRVYVAQMSEAGPGQRLLLPTVSFFPVAGDLLQQLEAPPPPPAKKPRKRKGSTET